MQGRSVFVTGGAGFVGRRFLTALAAAGCRVVALDRSGRLTSELPRCEVVQGDLLDPATYREALASCDTVVHLAAATGNASREQHHRVNADGAKVLVEEARRAGVTRFLFVSSIAVTFPNLEGYHYAQAKARAEAIVRDSGLRFLIVRPTMILGAGAPILAALGKLAMLPVAALPGSGRAQVEPIHVDDVASALVAALEMDAFNGQTVAVGGPDRISMETLIRRLRLARGGTSGPLVRIPLPFLQIPLKVAESIGLGRLLPITAGQLSSFRFDGVGTPNEIQRRQGPLRGLGEMLAPSTQRSTTSRTSASPPRPVNAAELDREVEIFVHHLLGCDADPYVRTKYSAAHAALPALQPSDAFDAFLVRFARRGPVFASLADAYAGLFAHASLLRKKLVLLVAILETSQRSHRTIDAPLGGRPMTAVFSLTATGLLAAVKVLAGSIILLPMRLVLSGSRSAR